MISREAIKAVTGGWKSGFEASAGGYTTVGRQSAADNGSRNRHPEGGGAPPGLRLRVPHVPPWIAPPLHKDASEADLRGGPSSSYIGGCRRLPKRLGAVTVGYKCH